MKSRFIILSVLSVMALSGCSGKYNPFHNYNDQNSSSVNVFDMQGPSGNGMTSMPNSPMNGGLSSSDVVIYDGLSNAQPMNTPMMPNYGNAVLGSGDSSVMLYPLDGAPMLNDGFGNNAMGQGYPASNNMMMGGAGNQIFFKTGSSRLGGGDRRVLSNVAEQAKFAPVNRVTVAGYASKPTQVGSNNVQADILNLKESMNRTFAVSKKLIQNGVPAEKIKAVSWGATKPTGNNRQDRRVDIVMGEQ